MLSFVKKLFFFIITLIILIVAFLGYSGYEMYKKAINQISIADKISQIQSDKNYTKLEDMTTLYKEAVVAIEDHRFFDHSGVDFISLVRAIVTNIKEGGLEQGGSTISQQLAKNMFFTQEKKFSRKIAELFVVHDLESNYSKETILELYINTMYFGQGYYGIYEASKGFFNKLPSELSDYESTYIAGIPNAPSIYSSKRHEDLAKQRHRIVLNAMVKYGKLNQEDSDIIFSSKP